nr:LacI family DNA-binding transcriptional regulator [Streptomyces sp. SolWspMP-sol7th]
MTFRAIADEAGVSIATVSRVVNGSTRVSEGTQRAVREAAQRLGSGFARTRGGAPPVLVYCPYALTDYFGTIVTSVVETLALHGRRALVLAGESAQDDTSALLALPEQHGIAGAVLVLPPGSTHDLEALHARRYPLVVVDPRAELPETVASVSAAHAAGARRVTRHLLGLGHRRIGFIGGPGDWLASRNRLVGHTAALGETGLLPDPALMAGITEPTTHEGHTAARLLLSRTPARPRSSRSTTRRRRGRSARRARRGSRCPGISRSRASTTASWARASRPRSPRSASRWRRWAAWPSRSSSASSRATRSTRCTSNSRRPWWYGTRRHRPRHVAFETRNGAGRTATAPPGSIPCTPERGGHAPDGPPRGPASAIDLRCRQFPCAYTSLLLTLPRRPSNFTGCTQRSAPLM